MHRGCIQDETNAKRRRKEEEEEEQEKEKERWGGEKWCQSEIHTEIKHRRNQIKKELGDKQTQHSKDL